MTKSMRTWINLSKRRRPMYWNGGYGRPRRRRKLRSPEPNRVQVEIISAITSERTKAWAVEESMAKLKKWLKIRNVRAEFEDMVISPKSVWALLSEDQWKDYPIIVKVGSYQTSYVVDHVGELHLTKSKSCVTVYLRVVGNVDYLSLINAKKQMVAKIREDNKAFFAKKPKTKKSKKK